MNVYILVEGKRTEKILYPAWLEFTVPKLTKVAMPEKATENNYYIISGNGFPSIITQTQQAVGTINDLHGLYDHFAVILDSEENTIEDTKACIEKAIAQEPPAYKLEIYIIVQHCCIETWLLGNKKMVSRNPASSVLREYMAYYNILTSDPEKMEKPEYYQGSRACFHQAYLNEIFKERTGNRFGYSKTNPGEAAKKTYFDTLVRRYRNNGDIQSFGIVLDFFARLNEQMRMMPSQLINCVNCGRSRAR